jgi:enterochelin esterase-like enzyme
MATSTAGADSEYDSGRRVAGWLGAISLGIAASVAVACAGPAARATEVPVAVAAPVEVVTTWSVGDAPAAQQVTVVVTPSLAEDLPVTTDNALPEYVGPIRGRFLEHWFDSAALDRSMRYFVYLPPGYETSSRQYPVLYLLHGASGEAEEWAAYGFLNRLDEGILTRQLNPFITVLPEGEFGYWLNHADEGPRWGDYLTHDVVADVDASYRTLRHAAGRAVGGLSMGGAGGLVQAFTHPATFGAVGAHSPSLREDNSVVDFLGEGIEFDHRDPVALAATKSGLDRLRIWLDVGQADHFFPRAQALHGALLERGVPHEWHVFPGEHYDGYWVEHTPDYLSFYSRTLGSNS